LNHKLIHKSFEFNYINFKFSLKANSIEVRFWIDEIPSRATKSNLVFDNYISNFSWTRYLLNSKYLSFFFFFFLFFMGKHVCIYGRRILIIEVCICWRELDIELNTKTNREKQIFLSYGRLYIFLKKKKKQGLKAYHCILWYTVVVFLAFMHEYEINQSS
jgi:hypothetical protein